jgi:uridine monophosphate synthetase
MASHTSYTAADLNAFIRRLIENGAVKIDTEQGFKFKHHEKHPDAPRSPTYINLRVPDNNGTLTQSDVNEAARIMHDYLCRNRIAFEGICGIPRAGEPFARALQERIYELEGRVVPLLTLLKEANKEGRRIGKLARAQDLPRGCTVLLIDDLITKAFSKFEAVDTLEYEGYRVRDCIVFLDREQGGRDELQNRGVQLHSIVGFTSVFLVYRDDGSVTADQYRRIMAYQASEQQFLAAAL